MLVEVTVPYLPMLGTIGTRLDVPEPQARLLILLKKVREVDDNDASLRTTRRVYQRRDMQAEGTAPPALHAAEGQPLAARTPRKRKASRVAPLHAESDE